MRGTLENGLRLCYTVGSAVADGKHTHARTHARTHAHTHTHTSSCRLMAMARFIMAASSGINPCIAIMYCSGSVRGEEGERRQWREERRGRGERQERERRNREEDR